MVPVDDSVETLVRAVATDMGAVRLEMTAELQAKLAEGITELRGDPAIQELLFGSIAGNLEIFVRIASSGGPLDGLSAPQGALEYARRLAQRGVTPIALLLAYRLGQADALLWALERIEQTAPDPATASAASTRFVELSFGYIDAISEQVVAEYDSERARWLSSRNAERTAVLRRVLDEEPLDLSRVEATLGYRLRQHHIAAMIWRDPHSETPGSTGLEDVARRVAKTLGASGLPLFAPQDQSSAWVWIPFGRTSAASVEDASLTTLLSAERSQLAIGAIAPGPDGFRKTHGQAQAARNLALLARDAAPTVTSWTHPEVPAAVMLARDLAGTRDLVRNALGGLTEMSEAAERLRETLLVFLTHSSAYPASAKAMHIHMNTMRYRIRAAAALRGSPIEHDRLNLELALIACKWLGGAVLAE